MYFVMYSSISIGNFGLKNMYSFCLDIYYQVVNERKVPIYIPLAVRVYLLNKHLIFATTTE